MKNVILKPVKIVLPIKHINLNFIFYISINKEGVLGDNTNKESKYKRYYAKI